MRAVRYFLEIAYKGTNYSGWQIQPEAMTVQSVLEQELSKILCQPIHSIGCGRTDAGVHASQFYLHFDFEDQLPEYFIFRINKMLPASISVKRALPVANDAHARFDATSRSYVYHIDLIKNPFYKDFSYSISQLQYDTDLMQEAAQMLMKYEDFTSFAKTGGNNKTCLCTMTESYWDFQSDVWKYHVSANRFLRGMVRRIVGALLYVGKKKISLQELDQCISEKKLFSINISVPPQGLFLSKVKYPYVDDMDQIDYLIK